MACKALIFDLDGTVWDSYPFYGAALDSVSTYGDGNTVELLRRGANIMELARKAGIGKAELSKLCSANISQLKLFHGVTEGLRQLMDKKVSLGIASNLPGWFVKPFLKYFEIDGLFASQVFSAGKPKPASLDKVIRELGVAKCDSFFIGDNESDAAASIAAGIRFGWATYGYGSQPSSEHVCISQFSDVMFL